MIGTVTMSTVDPSADDDPFVWLEEVESPQLRAWVVGRSVDV